MRDHSEDKHHHAKEYQGSGVVPFWPEHLLKELVVGLSAVSVLFVFSIFVHPTLGPIADPSDWAFQPAPDWYFFWVQNFFDVAGYYWGIIGLTPYDWVLMFLVPVIGIAALYAAPFLDRYPSRRLLKRPLMFGMLVFGLLFLGYFTANGVYANRQLNAAEPAVIFSSSCESCHSIQGIGGNKTGAVKVGGAYIYPPPLTHVGSIMTPAQIRQQLVNPVGGMPNLGLPPTAVSDMVTWLSAQK